MDRTVAWRLCKRTLLVTNQCVHLELPAKPRTCGLVWQQDATWTTGKAKAWFTMKLSDRMSVNISSSRKMMTDEVTRNTTKAINFSMTKASRDCNHASCSTHSFWLYFLTGHAEEAYAFGVCNLFFEKGTH